MRSVIDYCRESMTVTNIDQLPRGLGCSLLLVIESPYPNEYVAKRWLRKMPATTKRCEHVLRIGSDKPTTKASSMKYRTFDYRGQVAVVPLDSRNGFKGSVSYLCDYLNARWSGRARAYILSPRKLKRLEWLLANGYTAGVFGKLYGPNHEDADDPTASRSFKFAS